MNAYHADESPANGSNSPPRPPAGHSAVLMTRTLGLARARGLTVPSLLLDQGPTGVAGRHAVAGAEGAAEVRGAREAPGDGDREDRAVGEARIGEVAPGALQAGVADRLGHRPRLILEEAIEVGARDVVGAGERLGP